MRSKHIKVLLLFLFVVTGLFSPLMTVGAAATELSNPSRTPSLTGDVDYDYESDYRCDYVLKTEFPELSVLLFRLYYRLNVGSWSYASMTVLDSNTYKKDNFSPDDMGAIGGDDIDYYFYIKDSDNPAGEDTTATYSFTVNPDITPPTITNVVDDSDYVERDDTIQFNATITDASGIDNATLYWSNDKSTWTQETMSNIAGDVWSWTSSANDFSVGTLYYFVKAIDPSGNVVIGNDYATSQLSDAWDWGEGDKESFIDSAQIDSVLDSGSLRVQVTADAQWQHVYRDLQSATISSDYDHFIIKYRISTKVSVNIVKVRVILYKGSTYDSGSYDNFFLNLDDDGAWHMATVSVTPYTYCYIRLYLMNDEHEWTPNLDNGDTIDYDYAFLIDLSSFTVYDWDSPAVGTSTIVPSSDIENDDTVTVSSTMTDEDSDVDSAGIYYHDGTSWGTPSMSEGASNVWSGDISAQSYDETIDYAVYGADDYNNYMFGGSTNAIQHDFNEQLDGFVLWCGTSVTHDEDDGWASIRYSTTEAAGIKKANYGGINTANYRMFFIRWKTNTAYEQRFGGIYDGSQYVSRYDWADNYYTDYNNIDVNDGWTITYGYFDSDFYDTETELRFVWNPSAYPSQDTTDADYIYVDWIHLVYPKQYSIVDVTNPSLSNPDHSPTNPDETDAITLSVDVSDSASGVDEVKCYWRVNAGGWNNHIMSGSGTYTYEIGLFDIDDNLEYYFWANDSDGNSATLENGGSYYTISVTDQTNPVISAPDHSPTNPDENDAIVFSCHVTDNDYPDDVWCYFRVDGGAWSSDANSVMTPIGGNDWELNKAAFDIGEEIEYYFKAVDNSANEAILNNGGNYYSFTVTDDTVPIISNEAQDPTSDNVDYDDIITISATITDNNDVQSARAYYRIDAGEWQYVAMSEGASNVWSGDIGPFSYDEVIDWYIWAEDYHSNTETTSSSQFTTDDFIDPTLSAPDHSPTNPEETDSITLYVNATDGGSGIDTVLYFYRVNSGNWINGTMSGSVTYSASIGTFDIGDSLDYYFWCNDTAGNTKTLNNGGSYYSISVTDQENPTLSAPDHSPTNPKETDSITLYVNATDNGNIDTVLVYWRVNTGSWSNHTMSSGSGSGDTYSYEIGTFSIDDSFDYYFWSNDSYGNEATLNNGGSYYAISVTDQTNPTIEAVYRNPSGVVGDNVYVIYYALISDNGVIDTVLLYYREDGGSWSSIEMEYGEGEGVNYVVTVYEYYSVDTIIDWYIWTNDTYNNSAQSDTDQFTIEDNQKPVLSGRSMTPATFDENTDIHINYTVTDNGVLDIVYLHYELSYNGGSTWHNQPIIIMTNSFGGDIYNATIEAGKMDLWLNDDSYFTMFKYLCYANDTMGNYNNTAFSSSYQLSDFTPPQSASLSLSPVSPTRNIEVSLTVDITDNHVIDTTRLYYKINSSSWAYKALTDPPYLSDTYSATIGSFECLTTVYYYIYASDTTGNHENTTQSYFLIPDSIFPVITQHSVSYSQTPIRTNEGSLTVMYNLTDNDAISSAAIYYKHESKQDWTQDTLTLVEEKYQYIFENFADDGWYYYYLIAEDSSGNQKQSIIYSFYVAEKKEGEEPPPPPPPTFPLPPIVKDNPAVAIALPSTALLVIAITIIVNRISKKGKKKKKGGYG